MYSSVGPTKEIYPYEIEHTGGPYNEVYYDEISKRYNIIHFKWRPQNYRFKAFTLNSQNNTHMTILTCSST